MRPRGNESEVRLHFRRIIVALARSLLVEDGEGVPRRFEHDLSGDRLGAPLGASGRC